MAVGFDVANFTSADGTHPFVDLSRFEAKELYISIIEVIQEPQWTMRAVMDAVYDSCQLYSEASRGDPDIRYRVERIARTELNRILFYAKEQMAVRDGDADSLFVWEGPLDRRTTPMCRFMQTGELTGELRNGEPYDYEELRSELPEWRAEGRTLPELKDMCRQVHDVFHSHGLIGTPMITDWQMHINCRHTFRRSSKIDIAGDSHDDVPEMDGWIQIDEVEPGENPMQVEVIGDAVSQADETDDIEVAISQYAKYTFGFENSRYGIPSFYLPESDENDESAIFQFQTINEYGLGVWVRFVAEEMGAEMSKTDIITILYDESGMSNEEIGYIANNWDWLFDVALDEGWI